MLWDFFYLDSLKWVFSRAEIEPVLIRIPIREAVVKQYVFGYCSGGELHKIWFPAFCLIGDEVGMPFCSTLAIIVPGRCMNKKDLYL